MSRLRTLVRLRRAWRRHNLKILALGWLVALLWVKPAPPIPPLVVEFVEKPVTVYVVITATPEPTATPVPVEVVVERLPCISQAWPASIQQWEPLIAAHALAFALDPNLIASWMFQESRGDFRAVGASGEIGLFQVMPYPGRPSARELFDPNVNIGWAAQKLYDLRAWVHDLRKALAIYNCGAVGLERGDCNSHGGYRYADAVLRRMRVYGDDCGN